MRNYLLTGLFACCSFLLSLAQGPNHIVISQVYGGGGNAGAQYRNDFIELYNPTASPVSLTGWSVQYAAIDGANWNTNRVLLSGTIAPGRYYLIQLAGGANGAPLPTADLVAPAGEVFNMAANGGKVALVNTTPHLSGPCPATATAVVDFVGWGSAASLNCFEGTTGGGPITGNATAIHRRNNGCTDANNNAADLAELAPSPRNGAAQGHSCGTTISINGIVPAPFCVDAANGFAAAVNYTIVGALPATLSVQVSDATGSFGNNMVVATATVSESSGTIAISIPANFSSSTLYRLRVNNNNAYGVASNAVEVINGAKNIVTLNAFPDQSEVSVQWQAPSGCVDEYLVVAKQGGSIGAQPAGNGSSYAADALFTGNGSLFDGGRVVYKGIGNSVLVNGLTLGATYHFKVFTRRGTNWSTGVETVATTRIIPGAGDVLINAFSPRYANAADEFYELVNTTGKTFNLADLTLQYQSPTGGGRVPLNLGNILQPHSFWLLTPTAGTISVGRTTALAGDFSSGAGIADNGYIALVRRKDNLVIDAVGYGNPTGGTFFEGSLLPVLPPGGGAYRRRTDGADGNNNFTDFETIAPAQIDLRNSASRLANNNARIAGGNYRRVYVTGNSSIGGTTAISEKLVFRSGRLVLDEHNLAVNTVEGASANSFVQTNGIGVLVVQPPAAAAYQVPVGNATYNPLVLTNANGATWQVRVQDGVEAIGSERAVLRTWHVVPLATPAPTAALSFIYNEADPSQLGANFTSADGLQVWHRNAEAWIKAGGVVPAETVSGSFRSATLGGYPNFGPFVVASALAVLPVRFDGLQLVERGTVRELRFTAHNEVAIERYEVEWSADGQQFQTIGTLQPRNNAGGSEGYVFTDNRPLAGVQYYRVKAVEQDGTPLFSPVVSWLVRKQYRNLLLYPVPVAGGVLHYTIGTLPPCRYRLEVIDAGGALVWSTAIAGGTGMSGTINLQHLKPGTYHLMVTGPQRFSQAFVIR